MIRRELAQELPPDEPEMGTWRRVVRHRQADPLRHGLEGFRPPQREVGGADADPVVLDAGVLDLRQGRREFRGVLAARAPHANPAERARVVVGRLDGVAASHRQAGNRAVVLARQHAIVLLDERDDFRHEAVGIRALVDLRRPRRRRGAGGWGPWGCGSAGALALGRLDGRRRRRDHGPHGRRRAVRVALRHGLRRVAVRHDDDHRLRLARRDQVVEDDVGAAHRRPGVLVTAAAVQQVEHRVLRGARLVAGRRVDVHPAARLLQDRRRVPDGRHGAVRDVRLERPRVRRRPGNHEEIVVALAVALVLAVARVHHLDAVHVERVAPQLLAERAHGDRPDALVVLGHRDVGALLPVAVQHHGARLGRQQPERDLLVGEDLRRDHPRSLRRSRPLPGGRRWARCRCLRERGACQAERHRHRCCREYALPLHDASSG